MGALHEKGIPKDKVLEAMEALTDNDVNWRTGKVLTGLYDPGDSAHDLAVEAYTRFLPQNALYMNMYPSIGKMEKDVVDSIAQLLRADDEVAGNMTSGGTESILMAIKTARDWARANRPEIKKPEMVLPVTAHPAFIKAAHYLNIKAIQTAIDLNTYRADLDSFKQALGPNTIIAVGSAPNFSHGSIDPIAEMAAISAEKNILFHVDACVGGIYLSIMRRMENPLPDFDFSLPGVTSISADLHKYGYTPKNASVILYRNRDFRRYAWFTCSTTTEYIVINPTAQSSKTGGPVAAAWAMLRFLGEEGFRDIVNRSQEATGKILEKVKAIKDIDVLGQPDMCMFTMASEKLNVFEIDDRMRERGWHMIPQFACGGSPPNLHVSITQANVPHTEKFLLDLEDVVTLLRQNGSLVNSEEITRVIDETANSSIEVTAMSLIPLVGLTGLDLPEEMATLNTALNLIPGEKRDQLLTFFFNMSS